MVLIIQENIKIYNPDFPTFLLLLLNDRTRNALARLVPMKYMFCHFKISSSLSSPSFISWHFFTGKTKLMRHKTPEGVSSFCNRLCICHLSIGRLRTACSFSVPSSACPSLRLSSYVILHLQAEFPFWACCFAVMSLLVWLPGEAVTL